MLADEKMASACGACIQDDTDPVRAAFILQDADDRGRHKVTRELLARLSFEWFVNNRSSRTRRGRISARLM
ncbi:hypothetical protein OA90_21135 [Labrenzia sp. OB1]|nr:hypothetical protein OA90_21135 [Labrenzia sp. OB1]